MDAYIISEAPSEPVEEMSKHEYICEGCDRLQANDLTCGVYAFVPPYYIRHKCCPFNRKAKSVPKIKVRVGQQKTKSQRKGG
jgi:hypothetical protein